MKKNYELSELDIQDYSEKLIELSFYKDDRYYVKLINKKKFNKCKEGTSNDRELLEKLEKAKLIVTK